MSKTTKQQAHERIEQSYERQQHAILDSLPVIIFLLNEDGKYLEIIAGEQNQLYRTKDELLGKHLHDVFDKDTADIFLEAISNTLEQNKVSRLEYELDVIKGHAFFSGRLSPMGYTVDDKRVVLFLAIDVTEQKNKDIQLQHSMKMEAIGQLTGGIAHDFNNLLSIIIGNLDYLKSLTQHDAQSQTLIDKALTASTRGSELIKQLLMFARHQQGEVMLVDVNSIISMMDALIIRSMTPDIKVQHELHDDLWQTKMDPGEFENVLLNIIINAHDAMPEGGTLTIKTSNVVLDKADTHNKNECISGDYVSVCISDTGYGMLPEIKAKALEPFFTTKELGKGKGLGLSIVYGFMRSVDGCIDIESESGKGTVVKLYLPRISDAADTTGDKDTSMQTENTQKDKNTILVVDDEVVLLALAQEQIEDLGYRVYAASSSAQALQLLAEHKDIDLMFTDVIMPDDISGYELALKATELRPDLKILLASGFTSNIMKQKGLALFDAKVLHKPYRYEELSSKLREILDA